MNYTYIKQADPLCDRIAFFLFIILTYAFHVTLDDW